MRRRQFGSSAGERFVNALALFQRGRFECSGVVHVPVIVVIERFVPVVQIEFKAQPELSKGLKLGARNA